MANEPANEPQRQQQPPTEAPNPNHRTEIEPVCDEESGGGGSNPDTRFRGMPGGWPGGPLDEDCAPTARAKPDAKPDGTRGSTPDDARPTTAGKQA